VEDQDAGAVKKRAYKLWMAAYRLHMDGQLDAAIRMYSESIDIFPTAEAYTFRGWARSFQGEIDEAIADCKRAIHVDPQFGNPYNDIGSYLMRKGDLDEAIPWLEKAKRAVRYEPRHFPFLNLGRIYLQRGLLGKALSEFEGALKLSPGDESAQEMIRSLRFKLN
jgi:tetratricopeptide (TPR) repeat protein